MKRELRKAIREARMYKIEDDDLVAQIEDLYAEEIGSLKGKIKELEGKLPKTNHNMLHDIQSIYPFYTNKGIEKYLARGLGSNTLDELSSQYCKDINNNLDRHSQILELVKWAMLNNEVACNFGKFVTMRDYERIEMEYLKRKSKTTGYGLSRIE